MAEEKTLINELFLQFIYDVPDLKDKKNEKRLSQGYFTLTTEKISIVPEVNNKVVDDQKKTLPFNDITDVDRKIELWKKVVGATTIIPIHHKVNGNETVTLLSTTHENAKKIKNYLSVLLTNGKEVDYVCPFSEGGKIHLDKKPVNGNIYLKKTDLVLTAEWLGKKQQETINLAQIDDYEIGLKNGDPSSVTIKYQKNGILISTLINADPRSVSLLDTYIKLVSNVRKGEDDDVELNEQQLMLLQMMYTSDIDAAMATEMLGIKIEELQKMVNELVTIDILRVTGDEEYELTEKGTKQIVEYMKKNVGG
jgi:helix-turn-helix protein